MATSTENQTSRDFLIREASTRDLAGIKAIVDNFYRTPRPRFWCPTAPDTSGIEEDRGNIVFVAENSLGLVGYLHLHTNDARPFPCPSESPRLAGFEILVDPEYPRKGFGKHLTQHMLEYVEQKTSISLLVAYIVTCNTASFGLLSRFGFQMDHPPGDVDKGFTMSRCFHR